MQLLTHLKVKKAKEHYLEEKTGEWIRLFFYCTTMVTFKSKLRPLS